MQTNAPTPTIEDMRAVGLPVPAFVLACAEEFDEDTTIRFCRHYGGSRLYVPQTMGPEHKIVRDFGEELGVWLGLKWGGLYLDVPLYIASPATLKKYHVRRLILDGYSNAEVARLTLCHERSIERARSWLRENERLAPRNMKAESCPSTS